VMCEDYGVVDAVRDVGGVWDVWWVTIVLIA